MIVAEDTDEGTTRYRLLETLGPVRPRTTRRRRRDRPLASSSRRVLRGVLRACRPRASQGPTSSYGLGESTPSSTTSARCCGGVSTRPPRSTPTSHSVSSSPWPRGAVHDHGSSARWADALIPRARTSSIAGRSGVLAAAADWHMLQRRPRGRRTPRPRSPREPHRARGFAFHRDEPPGARLGALPPAMAPPDRTRTRGRGSPHALTRPMPHRPTTVRCTTSRRGSASASAISTVPEEKPMLRGDRPRHGQSLADQYSRWVLEGRAWFSDDPDRALAAFDESIALARAGGAKHARPRARRCRPTARSSRRPIRCPFPTAGRHRDLSRPR